jgi:steroid delta-isomerase-like uncharacterized protein
MHYDNVSCRKSHHAAHRDLRNNDAMSLPIEVLLVKRLHELWNTGEIERIGEVYAADFVAHFPPSSEHPRREGLAGVRMGITRVRTAFPDWFEHVEDLIHAGDKVVTRYTSTGTHRGPFWGIAPTGRAVSVAEISIYRIANGRVAEQWCLVDELARLQQLGATLQAGGAR